MTTSPGAAACGHLADRTVQPVMSRPSQRWHEEPASGRQAGDRARRPGEGHEDDGGVGNRAELGGRRRDAVDEQAGAAVAGRREHDAVGDDRPICRLELAAVRRPPQGGHFGFRSGGSRLRSSRSATSPVTMRPSPPRSPRNNGLPLPPPLPSAAAGPASMALSACITLRWPTRCLCDLRCDDRERQLVGAAGVDPAEQRVDETFDDLVAEPTLEDRGGCPLRLAGVGRAGRPPAPSPARLAASRPPRPSAGRSPRLEARIGSPERPDRAPLGRARWGSRSRSGREPGGRWGCRARGRPAAAGAVPARAPTPSSSPAARGRRRGRAGGTGPLRSGPASGSCPARSRTGRPRNSPGEDLAAETLGRFQHDDLDVLEVLTVGRTTAPLLDIRVAPAAHRLSAGQHARRRQPADPTADHGHDAGHGLRSSPPTVRRARPGRRTASAPRSTRRSGRSATPASPATRRASMSRS